MVVALVDMRAGIVRVRSRRERRREEVNIAEVRTEDR